MKKILAIITVLACVGLLVGCKCNSKKTDETSYNPQNASVEKGETKNKKEQTTNNGTVVITTSPSTKTQKATKKETAPQKNGNKKSTAKGGNIVGSWTWDGGIFVYVFNKDGSGVYTTGSEAMYFTYKTNGNKVTIKYKDGKGSVTMPYTVKGKTLLLKDENGDDMTYYKNKKHKNPNK